jgi:hypothetical protein
VIPRMNLDAIESSGSCLFDSSGVKFENAGNFRLFNGPMRRRLYPAMRRRYETGWILPIFRVHRGRNRWCSSREGYVGETPRMPQLSEHTTALAVNSIAEG